jgi:hypothetical protein
MKARDGVSIAIQCVSVGNGPYANKNDGWDCAGRFGD